MNPRSIVWPTAVRLEPNGVQRLARVLHWCFVGGACVTLASGVGSFGWQSYVVGAVGLAFFGRALRYIMAGE